MAKMETLFRNIVEDDKNNSLNDCTILSMNSDLKYTTDGTLTTTTDRTLEDKI